MQLVKVHYLGDTSSREYIYWSVDTLTLGDIVLVPVPDGTARAKVISVDVSEHAIRAFRDKMKTIPMGTKSG